MTYPQSHPIVDTPENLLQRIAANQNACTSIYLDTTQDESKSILHETDHHQGLARTHKLSDGSIYYFLSHSVIGGQGKLMQFHYTGPLDIEHVLTTNPKQVATLQQKIHMLEEHPADICFLPDIDGKDAGYLFVAEEFNMHRLSIYFWQPNNDLKLLGYVTHHFNNNVATVKPGGNIFSQSGPNFVFIDMFKDKYYLGLCNDNVQECALYIAPKELLFPYEQIGSMNIGAFRRAFTDITYPFPVTGGASQVKLVRSVKDNWSLLAYRSDPDDAEDGTDYVDVYPVTLSPIFEIGARSFSQHVHLRPGDTSFASTGTHYVEPAGRLLISSSYRWAEEEGPGDSSYVSRVDECPSF
jgi:hypothetical protein